ncbi:MAG: hypothetical protein AMXMBFR4_08950 [Candidatus Hydrogenedentota bacterium]
MNEREREERINDYVDGLLPPAERIVFETELEQDPALRTEVEELRSLIARASNLPKEIAPRRDLWVDIAPRLGARPAEPKLTPWRAWGDLAKGLAAAAAAALIFVAGMWYAGIDRSSSTPTAVTTTASGANGAVNGAPANGIELAAFKQVESDYAEVRAALHDMFDRVRPNLAPETVRVIDDSLKTIDNAIREIESALQKDPGDPHLLRSLVAVYDQEVGLLRNVTRISEQIPTEEPA